MLGMTSNSLDKTILKNAENFSTKALAVKKCHLQIDDVHSLYDRQKLRPLSD